MGTLAAVARAVVWLGVLAAVARVVVLVGWMQWLGNGCNGWVCLLPSLMALEKEESQGETHSREGEGAHLCWGIGDRCRRKYDDEEGGGARAHVSINHKASIRCTLCLVPVRQTYSGYCGHDIQYVVRLMHTWGTYVN